jgi:elongation factor Ts
MADVTPAMIKELRERTGAGMADCKAALVEAKGDMEQAVEIILKKGIVEVNCQTDFVSRGDDFKGFVTKVAEVAAKAAKGADLGAQKFLGTDKTVEVARQELVAKTGENMVIRRWDRLEAKGAHAFVHAYVHMGGKLAVLLSVEAPSESSKNAAPFLQFVDNCAMQIAAMNPMVVHKDELHPSHVAKQKEIFQAQLKEEKKPEQAWPKIIEGKVAKWLTEVTTFGIRARATSTSSGRSSPRSSGAR